MAAKDPNRKHSDETLPDKRARKPGSRPDHETSDVQIQSDVDRRSDRETQSKEKDGDYDGEKKDKATQTTREEAVPCKVFNDSVHGHIEIHPLCVKIIDTPQFQRLRDIKQLGGCYFVFPGASHNRFEHSIGTCYLAGKLVEGLRHSQPQLEITDKDVLCVKIAGLCHDLGHGPFSHMFDALFIPSARNDKKKWKHEKGSLDMFEHMVKDGEMSRRFEEYDLNDNDVSFIKELITGKPLEETTLKAQHEDASLKMFVLMVEENERSPRFQEYKLTKEDETSIKKLITGKRQEETTSKREDASLKLFELKQEKNEMLARFREHKLTEEDESFIKELITRKQQEETTSEHEDPSLKMIVLTMKENTVSSRFRKNELTEEDKAFIAELIAGKPLEESTWKGWLFKGRGIEKCFLYEIVANKRTGIDVDKFDYFARDCHGLGIKNRFDHKRYMKFAKVLKVDGVTQICVRDKEVNNIYDMFHTRSSLHRRAYQHKTSNAVERMITDALLKADEKILFKGDKKMLSISECIDDMEAYTKLSDNVYYQILNSSDPDLEEARDILRRIQNRDLYKCIGQTIVKPRENVMISGEESVAKSVAKSVAESVKKYPDGDSLKLDPNDFETDVVKFDYGMGVENPLDKVRFYSKNKPDEAFPLPKDQVSYMLPDKFQEHHIRVYFRKNDNELLKQADRWFGKWLENYTKEGEDAQVKQTPLTSSPGVGLNTSQESGLHASQEGGFNTSREVGLDAPQEVSPKVNRKLIFD